MAEEENNGNGGNPGKSESMVSPELCLEYRRHIETKIDNMGKNLSFTIKIVGALTALIIAIIQIGLQYLT